jgi:hypothetical protein
MNRRPRLDTTLRGHVLIGRRASYRLEGQDRRGRVLGRRLTASGNPRGALVVIEPDRWAGLERLLARMGRRG